MKNIITLTILLTCLVAKAQDKEFNPSSEESLIKTFKQGQRVSILSDTAYVFSKKAFRHIVNLEERYNKLLERCDANNTNCLEDMTKLSAKIQELDSLYRLRSNLTNDLISSTEGSLGEVSENLKKDTEKLAKAQEEIKEASEKLEAIEKEIKKEQRRSFFRKFGTAIATGGAGLLVGALFL